MIVLYISYFFLLFLFFTLLYFKIGETVLRTNLTSVFLIISNVANCSYFLWYSYFYLYSSHNFSKKNFYKILLYKNLYSFAQPFWPLKYRSKKQGTSTFFNKLQCIWRFIGRSWDCKTVESRIVTKQKCPHEITLQIRYTG